MSKKRKSGSGETKKTEKSVAEKVLEQAAASKHRAEKAAFNYEETDAIPLTSEISNRGTLDSSEANAPRLTWHHPKRASPLVPFITLLCVSTLVFFAFWVSQKPVFTSPEYGGISGTEEGKPGKTIDGDLARASEEAKRKRDREFAQKKKDSGVVAKEATATTNQRVALADGCRPDMASVTTKDVSVCIDKFEYPGQSQIPRVKVSWDEASELCKARQKRLCSVAEWEAGCRGGTKQTFPYGFGFRGKNCNSSIGAPRAPQPTGSFEKCESPIGAFDMGGNVSEWVAPGGFTKGGSSRDGTDGRCEGKESRLREQFNDVGFRCCSDKVE